MNKSYRIALSGISGALSLAALIGAALIPTANAAFWAAAALCLLIPVINNKKDIILSVLVYITASSLSLLITGNFFDILPFICFFGPYAIFWHFFDSTKISVFIKYIVEFVLLFLGIWLCYALIKALAFEHVRAIDDFVKEKWWLALIIIAAGLPLYNFALKEGKILLKRVFRRFNQSR